MKSIALMTATLLVALGILPIAKQEINESSKTIVLNHVDAETFIAETRKYYPQEDETILSLSREPKSKNEINVSGRADQIALISMLVHIRDRNRSNDFASRVEWLQPLTRVGNNKQRAVVSIGSIGEDQQRLKSISDYFDVHLECNPDNIVSFEGAKVETVLGLIGLDSPVDQTLTLFSQQADLPVDESAVRDVAVLTRQDDLFTSQESKVEYPSDRVKLRTIVEESFAARQEQQAAEIRLLKERLVLLEKRMERREAMADQIISRYVDVLSDQETPTKTSENLALQNIDRNGSTAEYAAALEWIRSVPITRETTDENAPVEYRVVPGDKLGIYIPSILGEDSGNPPTIQATDNSEAAIGFPIKVRENGTISLPRLDPIKVTGMTLEELEHFIKKNYVAKRILMEKNIIVMVSVVQDRNTRMRAMLNNANRNRNNNQSGGHRGR